MGDRSHDGPGVGLGASLPRAGVATARGDGVAALVGRIGLIDRLRGLVICLMVLDHVRENFNREALLFQATDLDKTNALLFATRWVTHLCAPTFVLLAGASIYLQRERGKRGGALSRFLVTRGLWLILLEVTFVTFSINFAYPFFFFQVIYAIGLGMILMAGMVWLPARVSLVLGAAIIVLGETFIPSRGADLGAWTTLATFTLRPGVLAWAPGFVAYPAIPWFGIMLLGYGIGGVFLQAEAERNRSLAAIGLSMLAGFVVLRLLNGYGDVSPWSVQRDTKYTVLSFLNVSKYPPSLDYVLATLGVSLSLAPAIDRLGGIPGRIILALGRTPLFTYLIHLPLVHLAAMALGVAMGYPAIVFTDFIGNSDRLVDSGWGIGIGWTYILWLSIILALWPVSAWFANLRQRRRDWWLSYM